MSFWFQRLQIPEIILIEPTCLRDARGFFRETFKQSEFAANGIALSFVQSNHSRSARSVVRGLHYQMHPHAQGKLLTAIHGEIFDVAVDIRKGSPTFGKWVGIVLSDANCRMLYVPPGFAHGFAVLSDEADLMYQTTAEYAADLERGIAWNDPRLAIDWRVAQPILSPRDAQLPLLRDAENNFEYLTLEVGR
ncbi:MAG: dTDP-4-dehydrorhamnose 3,5-epimerase [Chloroflexi bacterium]|nr:dTDP-4-dehydrorhamnose 3,5-epimerase [Chloroflexota bacterium]